MRGACPSEGLSVAGKRAAIHPAGVVPELDAASSRASYTASGSSTGLLIPVSCAVVNVSCHSLRQASSQPACPVLLHDPISEQLTMTLGQIASSAAEAPNMSREELRKRWGRRAFRFRLHGR